MDNLQPDDACEECRSHGLNHKLRWFYINLEEKILKCESRSCLWPHNDEVSSDEDDSAEIVDIGAVPDSIEAVQDSLDDFIIQLLQLGPEAEEPATGVELCSIMASNEANIPNESNYATGNSLIHIEQILELPKLTETSCIATDNNGPKINELSSNDKSLSDTHSMPLLTADSSSIVNLSSQSQPKPDTSILIAASSSEAIEFSISIDPTALEESTQKVKTKYEIPKAAVFQTAPKKASTFTAKQLPKETKQKPASPPSQTSSAFLDALKRQPETRFVRPMRQQRGTRRNTGNAAAAGGLAGSVQPNTRQVMQCLQSIEARRRREIKTEPDQEAEREK